MLMHLLDRLWALKCMPVASMESLGVICLHLSAAYPAVYGQFPQAIPQPMSAVAPTQREGKAPSNTVIRIALSFNVASVLRFVLSFAGSFVAF